jgi:hypothetical protein
MVKYPSEFLEMDEMTRLEYETVKDLANQIGIRDIDLETEENYSTIWAPQFAALFEIVKIQLQRYSYWVSRIVTLLALVPVLIFLTSRRNYIDV